MEPYIQRLKVVREAAPAGYGVQIFRPEDAAAFGARLVDDSPVEQSWVLLLDRKHRVRGAQQVGLGEIASAPMPAREILQAALIGNAAAIVLVHNHPSGDPRPSTDDAQVTRRIARACELVGIEFVDHIIVGDGTFSSARGDGWA